MAIKSRSITSANSVIMLSITDLFDTPQQLQGYATDDITSTEEVVAAETAMGMDGKLSAGFVPMPIAQTFVLQANSLSNDIFDRWNAAMRQAQDIFVANGSILYPSISKKWACTNGILTRRNVIPQAQRTLRPRSWVVTWESVLPAPA